MSQGTKNTKFSAINDPKSPQPKEPMHYEHFKTVGHCLIVKEPLTEKHVANVLCVFLITQNLPTMQSLLVKFLD